MILEDKEKRNLKERVELLTALFGCVTAAILIVKTLAETIKESKQLLAELKKEDKGEDND